MDNDGRNRRWNQDDVLMRFMHFGKMHHWMEGDVNGYRWRFCSTCRKMQEYTLVDAGMRKIWITTHP